jgi:hypothetical protein
MIEVDLINEKELSETLRTARNDLYWQFCDTALWWENADTRDAKAAELLYSLSLSVGDVEDVTLIAYLELFGARQEDEDEFYELLNSTGREWFPQSADAFVRRFISERTGSWVDPQNVG